MQWLIVSSSTLSGCWGSMRIVTLHAFSTRTSLFSFFNTRFCHSLSVSFLLPHIFSPSRQNSKSSTPPASKLIFNSTQTSGRMEKRSQKPKAKITTGSSGRKALNGLGRTDGEVMGAALRLCMGMVEGGGL